MSQKGLELQRNTPLNKKIAEFFWGSWHMECMWNFENQQGASFMRGMSNTLDRLYCEPDEIEKKKERYRAEDEFYNSTPQCGAFILGVAASMEEEYPANPDSFYPHAISSVKTTLMGPLAVMQLFLVLSVRLRCLLVSLLRSKVPFLDQSSQ